jgi:RNA polymerase sigma-70 factor (ECF subfamily)
VRQYGNRLLAVARRLLRNEEDARDAVQDAFLSALRSMDRFERRAQLSTWLHRIVVNAALMKLRGRRRRPEEPLDERYSEGGQAAHLVSVGSTEAPDELLERRELCARIRQAIDALPDPYRTVLLLRDIDELDTSETARVLGVSATVVRSRLHRAHRAMRSLLELQPA